MTMAMNSSFAALLAVAGIALAGCQSAGSGRTAAADARLAASVETALPTTLPADAVQLSGDQIRTAFANMNESYVAIDRPGVTATGVWMEDTMSANWVDGDATGRVAGTWRVDGDQRCIDFTEGPAGTTECGTMYRYGEGYLSVNPDGSLHGYHVNTPI